MVTLAPPFIPTLGRGRHRSSRRGACFMEMASYLAGERWSDHPRCTQPLLASVARLVNDNTTDDARQCLAPLIPSVIGLTSDDERWNVVIARRTALTALPVVAFEHQRSLAVGLLTCERMLARLDGRPADSLSDEAESALDGVPAAARWAREYSREHWVPTPRFHQRSAPAIVLLAVASVTESCGPGRDGVLAAMLEDVIEDCRVLRDGRLGADLVEGVGGMVHGEPAETREAGVSGDLTGLGLR